MIRPKLKGGADWSDADYIAYWKSRCIVTEKGCWEWQGFQMSFRNQKPGQPGYPDGSYRGKKCRIHRKMLELKLGRALGPKEQSCHDCDHPPCINPDHLYPGTNQQNHLDGARRGRMQGQWKTHCKRGHEFNEQNTWYQARPGGGMRRTCLVCQKIVHNQPKYIEWRKQYQQRRRAEKRAQKESRA
jgi:hypothetical protein